MKAILKRGTRYLNSYEEAKSRIQGMKAFREDDWDFAARQGTLDAYSTAIANSDNVDLDKMNKEYGLDYGNQETRIQALYNEVGADRTKLVKRTRNVYDEQGNITGTEDYEMTDYDYTKSLIKQYTDYHKALQDAEWEKSLKENRSFFGKLAATVLNAGWHFSKGMMDSFDNMYKFMMGIGEAARFTTGAGEKSKYIKERYGHTTNEEALADASVNYTLADAVAEGFQKTAFFEWLDEKLGTTDFAMEFERNYVLGMDTQGTGNWWRNFWDGTEESAGNMFAAWKVGSIFGKIANSVGAASSEVATVSKIASTTAFYGAMTAGNVREVYDSMADNCGITSAQILANAALKSVFQLGVEHTLGRLFGGASSLDNLVFGRTARNVAGSTLAKAGTKRLLTDMLQEGLEEVFQDWSDYWVNKWFTQYQNENFGQFTTRPTLQTMFDAFLGGAIMSLGGSAIQILNQKKEYLGALDKAGNIKLDENGKPIYKKLSKMESWEYTFQLQTYMQQMNSVIEEVEKYNREGIDVSEQLSDIYKAALSEAYASYRILHDMYNSMGDERFGQAMNCLKTISEMEKLDREKAYETYDDYKTALMLELKDLNVSARVASIVGEIDAKKLKEKRLRKIQKVFNRKEVSSIPDNVDYKNTLKEVFNGMPTLQDVIITREGSDLIIDGQVLIIPENLLKASTGKTIFSADAESRMLKALTDVFEQWTIAGNTKGVLNQILDVYKQVSGDKDANYAQAMLALLYDPEFFKSALYTTDIDAVKMLTAFEKLYMSIVDSDVREQIYKTKVGKAIRDMRRNIIVFMCEQPLCDIGYINLTDKERAYVEGKRWGKDRMLRLLYGLKANAQDLQYLDSQINNAPIPAERKEQLRNDIRSEDKATRIKAVQFIRDEYKNTFYGKYDGVHYLQPTSIANCAFNQYLMRIGLTMDRLFAEDALTDNDKELLGEKRDAAAIINYRKQQFFAFNGNYTIGLVDGKVSNIYSLDSNLEDGYNVMVDYWQSKERNEITLSDGTTVKLNDDRVTVTKTYSRSELLDNVLNSAISKGVRATIEVNDVVSDPWLLNADTRDLIMAKYGAINPATTYAFLHDYFANKTKNTTLVVDRTGKVTFADYTESSNILVNADKFDLSGSTTIADVVDKQFLTGSARYVKLEVIDNPNDTTTARFIDVDYTKDGRPRVSNTLIVNKAHLKGAELKLAFLHEFRHALAFANGLSSGFSMETLKTADSRAYRVLADDFRKHMPADFEGIEKGSDAEYTRVSSLIYFMAGGEIAAAGLTNTPAASFISVAVDYSDKGTIITTPWGIKHNLGDVKNDELNKILIANAAINNDADSAVEPIVSPENIAEERSKYNDANKQFLQDAGWGKRLHNKDSRLRQEVRDKMTPQVRDNMMHLLHIDLGMPCEYTDFEKQMIPVVRVIPANTKYNDNNFASAYTGNTMSDAAVHATPFGVSTNNLGSNYIVKSGVIPVSEVKAYINGELFISDAGVAQLRPCNISTVYHTSDYISDIALMDIKKYRDASPKYIDQRQAIDDRQRLLQVYEESYRISNDLASLEMSDAQRNELERKLDSLWDESSDIVNHIESEYIKLSYQDVYENIEKFPLYDLRHFISQARFLKNDNTTIVKENALYADNADNIFDIEEARDTLKHIIERNAYAVAAENSNQSIVSPGRRYVFDGPNPFYWNKIDTDENILNDANTDMPLLGLNGEPVIFDAFDGYVGYRFDSPSTLFGPDIVPLSTWFDGKPIMSTIVDVNGDSHSVYYKSGRNLIDAYTGEVIDVSDDVRSMIGKEASKRLEEYRNREMFGYKSYVIPNKNNMVNDSSKYKFITIENIRDYFAMNANKKDAAMINKLLPIAKSIGLSLSTVIEKSEAAGDYIYNHVVIDRGQAMAGFLRCRLLIHEIMHSITTSFVDEKSSLSREAIDAYIEFYKLSVKYLQKEDIEYAHKNPHELLSEVASNLISENIKNDEHFKENMNKLNNVLEDMIATASENIEYLHDRNLNPTGASFVRGTDKNIIDLFFSAPPAIQWSVNRTSSRFKQSGINPNISHSSQYSKDNENLAQFLTKNGKPRKGFYEYTGPDKNTSLYVDSEEVDIKKYGFVEGTVSPDHKYLKRYILIDNNGKQKMKKGPGGALTPVYSYTYVADTRTLRETETSSLKYFLNDKTRIELPEDVKAFVEYSDSHAIDAKLQDKIDGAHKGTLRRRDIMDFLRDNEDIDGETFNAIKQIYFPNSPIESPRELRNLVSRASEYYALRAAINASPDKSMQFENDAVNPDDAIVAFRAWLTLEGNSKYAKIYKDVMTRFNDNKVISDKYLRMLFMKYYDGTLYSAGKAAGAAILAARLNFTVTGEGASRIKKSTNANVGKGKDDGRKSMTGEDVLGDTDESTGGAPTAQGHYYGNVMGSLGEDADYLEKIETIKQKMQVEIAKLAKANDVDINQVLEGLYYIGRILSGDDVRKNGKMISPTEIDQLLDDYINNNMSLDEIDQLYNLSIFSDVLGIESTDKNFVKLADAVQDVTEEAPTRKSYNVAQNIYKSAKRIKELCDRYKVTPAMRKKLVEDSNGILDYDLTVKDDAIKNVKIGEDYTGKLSYRSLSELLRVEDTLKRIKNDLKNTAYANAEFHSMLKRERAKADRYAARLERILADKTKAGTVYDKGEYKTHTYRVGKSDVKFQVDEQTDMPEPLKKMFNEYVTTAKQTQVQLFAKEGDTYNVSGIDKFIKDNTDTLLSMSQEDIDSIVRYLINTHYSLDTDVGRAFNNIKTSLLAYILKGNAFLSYELDEELRNEMEVQLRTAISGYGQGLANVRVLLKALRPEAQHTSAYIERFDIPFTEDEQTRLYYALISHDKAQLDKVKEELYTAAIERSKDRKETMWSKLYSFESAMMLSAPTTWARNYISNVKIEYLNKWSGGLGNFITKMFPKKERDIGFQYKLIGTQTAERYRDWIQVNLKDSGLSKDILVGLSKYDLYRSNPKYFTKEHTLVSSVIDGIVSAVYRDTQWRTKSEKLNAVGNKIYSVIFTAISDNKFIERAALGYAGKMMTERNVALDKGLKSDEIIKIIGDAYVLAAEDYMHKPNFMSNMESKLFKRGTAGWFMFKQIFPFASASWNWWAEALHYTPTGLATAIVNYCKLEQTVAKMEEQSRKNEKYGGTSVDKSFATFIATRNIGKGVLGSIGMMIAGLLVALGAVRLDEEDDKYKIDINGVKFDFSNSFGMTGMYLGMTLMQSIVDGAKGEQDGWTVFRGVFNSVANGVFEDSVFAELYDTLRYKAGMGDIVLAVGEDALSKFWPNFLKVLSAEMNSRYRQYDNGFSGRVQKVLAKWLPGYALTLPSQVDPYTGEFSVKYDITPLNDDFETILLQAFNKHSQVKIVPYKMSDFEKEAIGLGVKTGMLSCKYNVNGEAVNFSNEEVVLVNQFYGKLNKNTLSALRENRIAYTVKDAKGKDVKLLYSKMTDSQKQSAINSIINRNQSLAKIYALTRKGYKYYATPETFKACKTAGIDNVYYKVNNKSGYIK